MLVHHLNPTELLDHGCWWKWPWRVCWITASNVHLAMCLKNTSLGRGGWGLGLGISLVSQQRMNDVGFQSRASSLVLCVCTCGGFLKEHRGKLRDFLESNLASSYTCTSLARLNGTLDRWGCQPRYTPFYSPIALMRGSICCASQPAIHPGRLHSSRGLERNLCSLSYGKYLPSGPSHVS